MLRAAYVYDCFLCAWCAPNPIVVLLFFKCWKGIQAWSIAYFLVCNCRTFQNHPCAQDPCRSTELRAFCFWEEEAQNSHFRHKPRPHMVEYFEHILDQKYRAVMGSVNHFIQMQVLMHESLLWLACRLEVGKSEHLASKQQQLGLSGMTVKPEEKVQMKIPVIMQILQNQNTRAWNPSGTIRKIY